jgi:hypothetical protein
MDYEILNRFAYVTEMHCVPCKSENERLNFIQIIIMFHRTYSCSFQSSKFSYA